MGVDFDARIVQIVSIATVILIIAFNNRFVEANTTGSSSSSSSRSRS